MIPLLWASPLLLVVAVLASRRASSLVAGLVGAAMAALVAVTVAPELLTGPGMAGVVGRGLWLSWLVGLVIFAGLFFRAAVTRPVNPAAAPASLLDAGSRRRRAFTACFLLGPFAEAATGFGVGQVTTIAILLALGLSPLHVALLGLFSQILVPWGAMANGTMVGAAFAGMAPHDLGTLSAIASAPLVLGWLFLFWWLAGSAGLKAGARHRLDELGWTAAMLAALPLANLWLGPEIAALVALGPLIVLRFWLGERPDKAECVALLPVALPYAVLIVSVALTRAVPALNAALGVVAVRPFPGASVWFPLLHPGTWLVTVGLLTVVVLRRTRTVPRLLVTAWWQACKPVATIGAFLVMAQLMAESGTARSLATELARGLGAEALLAVPLLAGVFGFVTGSGNATNALLMTSQLGLAAQHGVSLPWVAAVQNVAASALTMLSPARVSMGCALAGSRRLEELVYARGWVLGVVPVVLLVMLCGALLLR